MCKYCAIQVCRALRDVHRNTYSCNCCQRHQNYEITHMESCYNPQKLWNKSKLILYLRFFKIATICLDDSFAHSWHSLNQLHTECFSYSLLGVPTYAEHLLAPFPSLCGPTHLNFVDVRWLCRPGHLMQRSITLLLGQIAHTAYRCVLGRCPVEKQVIVPLIANQMGWCIATEWCGSHAG